LNQKRISKYPRQNGRTSGRTADDIFPDLHPAKMAFLQQKKKLKPVLFLIFIEPLAGKHNGQ
jgi:hypothetical protein